MQWRIIMNEQYAFNFGKSNTEVIEDAFEELKNLGIVKTKKQFLTEYCNRQDSYLRVKKLYRDDVDIDVIAYLYTKLQSIDHTSHIKENLLSVFLEKTSMEHEDA